jgi:peptidoglycan/LPS O-acetylase OafA/YrhL
MKKEFFTKFTSEYPIDENTAKSSSNSLRVLGWLAIALGLVVILIGRTIYGVSWFTSISASATYYGTAYILPFVLGGMSVYFWGYCGYTPLDRVCTKIMSLAAFLVAMFQCHSEFNNCLHKTGLLGLSPTCSNIVHTAAAVVLFATLIIWIGVFFRKTHTDRSRMSRRKRQRNIVYLIASHLMFAGLIFTVLDLCGLLKINLPLVWLWEELILLPAGIAILIKSGLALKDEESQ